MTERIYLSILKDEPEILTVPDVSRILRIGKNKAYEIINKGTLLSLKIGGKIIVPKIYLITFLLTAQNLNLGSEGSESISSNDENFVLSQLHIKGVRK